MNRLVDVSLPVGRPTAAQALAQLLAGNERFRRDQGGAGLRPAAAHAAVQHPIAAVFGCLDSRVAPEIVFDQPLGTLAVVRVGAHVLDQAGEASLRFAVEALEVPLVVVLGHQYCAAVAAAARAVVDGTPPAGFLAGAVAAAIDPADGGLDDVIDGGVRRHVIGTAEQLREAFAGYPAVEVVAARYDVDTGTVEVL